MAILDTLDKIATGLNMPVVGGGLFEKLAGKNLTYTGSTPQNRAYTQFTQSAPNPVYTGGGVSYNNAKKDYSTDGGGDNGLGTQSNPSPSFNYPSLSLSSPTDSMGGGPSEQDVINNEFNNFNSYLDQQESTAKGNFNETKGMYDTMKSNAEQQYSTEKSQQTVATKKQESLDLAKVRQLLADLSQRDAARTAISGGGSISEALGERFGREAQGRLGNVQDQAQQSIQRVNTFYDNAITKLNETYQSNVLQAKQTLDENLSQISSARVSSAAAKQRSTLDAWKNFYNNLNQAKIQAANFKAQYDLWKQQQDNSLAAIPEFNLGTQGAYAQNVQSSLAPINQPTAQAQTNKITMNPYYNSFTNSDEEKRKQQMLRYA